MICMAGESGFPPSFESTRIHFKCKTWSQSDCAARDILISIVKMRRAANMRGEELDMHKATIGAPIPDVEVKATDAQTFNLGELKGKNVILYFYPKDNTPGCTTEGQDFRDHYDEFAALDTVIFGVSKDSLASHESFKEKQCFPFDLIADTDGSLCELFDVIKEKNLYGKVSLGIERSTFIFDKKGVLRKEFRKVKVDGHVRALLTEIQNLTNT